MLIKIKKLTVALAASGPPRSENQDRILHQEFYWGTMSVKQKGREKG